MKIRALFALALMCSDNHFSLVDLGAAATTFNISGISSSLNDHNHVAGYVPGSSPRAEAAIYADGKVKLLGTLGGSFSYALGVNDPGKIVGYSYLPADTTLHAALFSTGHAPIDLGTLGGSTSVATAINESRTIVGSSALVGDKPPRKPTGNWLTVYASPASRSPLGLREVT